MLSTERSLVLDQPLRAATAGRWSPSALTACAPCVRRGMIRVAEGCPPWFPVCVAALAGADWVSAGAALSTAIVIAATEVKHRARRGTS